MILMINVIITIITATTTNKNNNDNNIVITIIIISSSSSTIIITTTYYYLVVLPNITIITTIISCRDMPARVPKTASAKGPYELRDKDLYTTTNKC